MFSIRSLLQQSTSPIMIAKSEEENKRAGYKGKKMLYLGIVAPAASHA